MHGSPTKTTLHTLCNTSAPSERPQQHLAATLMAQTKTDQLVKPSTVFQLTCCPSSCICASSDTTPNGFSLTMSRDSNAWHTIQETTTRPLSWQACLHAEVSAQQLSTSQHTVSDTGCNKSTATYQPSAPQPQLQQPRTALRCKPVSLISVRPITRGPRNRNNAQRPVEKAECPLSDAPLSCCGTNT
jgi:hypothetical protein